MSELREHVAILKQRDGIEELEDNDSMLVQVDFQSERINLLWSTHTDQVKKVESQILSILEKFNTFKQDVGGEVALLKMALANPPNRNKCATLKMKVPESKSFNNAQNAKELENFLWDMEQYFKGV